MPRIQHLVFLFLLLLTTNTIMSAKSNSGGGNTKTYYETLEIPKDASPTTIKKAYRRLALKYHPDKNRDDPSGTTTEKFRTVSEAYEVLSDETQKREYDRALRNGMSGGGGGGGTGYGGGTTGDWQNQWERNRRSNSHFTQRDPFAQFNDLFQNDPFFREASEGLEDLFTQKFEQQGQRQQQTQQGSNRQQPNNNNKKSKQGWGSWLIDKMGIDVQMSSTTVGRDGQRSTSTFSQQSNRRSHTSSTYTSKSTRTVVENGKRVTIQSMEKDGNKIEEKYVGRTLVGRSINGVEEQVGRIDL